MWRLIRLPLRTVKTSPGGPTGKAFRCAVRRSSAKPGSGISSSGPGLGIWLDRDLPVDLGRDIDDAGTAHQQVIVYANGVVLAYDDEHDEDEYGALMYADFDLEEFSPFEITRRECFDELAQFKLINRHRDEPGPRRVGVACGPVRAALSL
ncbi:hypothetical protein [Streptosporangium sp. NPDC004631]